MNTHDTDDRTSVSTGGAGGTPGSKEGRSRAASFVSDEDMEGRLSAHRYILSHLLTKLVEEPAEMQSMLRWLDERASQNDSEEDPGSVIVQGFAEQRARADEFDRFSKEVKRLLESNDRS